MLNGTRRNLRDEEGLSLVLVALSVVVLMTFVAFSVDLGAVYNERRQDQSAADTGVLSGSQMLSATRVAAADEVIRITRESIDQAPSLAEWTNQFINDCQDSDRTARGYTQTATGRGDCISFTPNNQRMRVKLPTIAVETAFAGVVGIDSISTSAFAEAIIDLDASADVLPYALPSVAAGNNEACIKSGSNPKSPDYPYGACNGADEGNFGRADFTLFGNETLGTTQNCTGNADARSVVGTAVGVDHPLSLHETGTLVPMPVNELETCRNGGDFLARPNEVATQTGNPSQALNEGLYYLQVSGLPDGVRGRLAQPSKLSRPFRTVRAGYPKIDDNPLWHFLTPGLTFPDVPKSCEPDTFDASSTKADMIVCLEDYRDGGYTTVLFGRDSDGDASDGHYDIQDSKRFSWVPEMWAESLGPGTKNHRIRKFRAAFLQTLFFDCQANSCGTVFEPGENSLPAPKNKKAEAMTAMLLRDSMLPQAIVDDAPGTTSDIRYSLYR